MVGPGLSELRLVRVRRAASLPVVGRYKSCVLGSGVGLDAGTEALRSRVVWAAALRADRVVGDGFGRVEGPCQGLNDCGSALSSLIRPYWQELKFSPEQSS